MPLLSLVGGMVGGVTAATYVNDGSDHFTMRTAIGFVVGFGAGSAAGCVVGCVVARHTPLIIVTGAILEH